MAYPSALSALALGTPARLNRLTEWRHQPGAGVRSKGVWAVACCGAGARMHPELGQAGIGPNTCTPFLFPGNNDWGQIGDGTKSDRYVPTKVAGGQPFKSIATSTRHSTCALDANGEAWCWGQSFFLAKPGDDADFPTPTRVAPGVRFSSIAVGEDHMCGIEANTSSALCW